MAHAEIDQPRFLVAGDDFDAQTDIVGNLLDEVAAVRRLAYRAGRDRRDAADPLALGKRAEGGQRLHAGVDRLRRQPAVTERLAAEAHHLLGAIEDAKATVRLDLSHHHVDGIAADVDSRNTHGHTTSAAAPITQMRRADSWRAADRMREPR